MAIGARITSENLSGKTATVTFVPYTGETSGTTVNLGSKTIPFNNINTHPYGVYSLYLAEYDYTYTLTIPEPVTDSQLYVYVSRIVNDNNYGAATLNFNDFTATVIDLNVNTNDYYISDLYPLTNSGYGYHFRGDANNSDRIIVFTDAANIEVDRYTCTTGMYDFSDLDGRWILFNDYNNGVIKYFNGVEIFTYEYDSQRYSIDLQWDYDSTMSNGSFVIIKYDEGQGTDHHAVLFKPDGTTSILKSWGNSDYADYNFQLQFNNDIFVIEKWDTDNSVYAQIEICNLDGTVLETVSLTGATYESRDYEFYGTNKYCTVLYNNDVNTAYKIINYNFNTTTLIETSHVRGGDYPYINSRGDSYFWPNEYLSENLMLSFHNSDWNWNTFGPGVSYMDVMYIFGNQSSFTTFVFANDESKNISPYFDQTGSNMFRARCINGDGVASVLTITSGATHIESLGVNISTVYNNNYWDIDNRTVYGLYTDEQYTGFTMVLIGATGGTQDVKSIQFYSAWGENENRSQYKSFYFGCNSITLDGYGGWYVNDTTTEFVQTGYYNWQSRADNFYTPTFLENSDIVLYNYGENTARVLKANGISNEFSLPAWGNNKGIEVGDTMFMYYYTDTDNNYYHVKLYDFDGTLLNTLDTTYTDYDSMIAVKDRFVARFYDNNSNKYVMYMISTDNIASVQLDDYNTYDTANDYIWWD